LPAGKVSLKQEKEKIAVVCGQIKAQINGLGAEEFPEIPGFKSKDSLWQMESTELFLICKEVAFAASADESRPALNAVWVKPEKDKMVFAATDGYRLSRREMPGKFQEDKPLLVPAKALKEVARIITGKEGRVKLAADKKQNQMIFLMQNIQVVSRLIEAEFPPFDKIIPQNCQTKIFFDRELLIQALKTAAIFARESANIIKFKIQNPALSAGRPASPVSTPNLKISANAPQIGENETEIEAKIKGETLEIAFNFRFIQEFLNSVEEDEIEAEFSGALSPALFRVKGKPDFIHIIMPVRVQAE